jgi:hypothetical protein
LPGTESFRHRLRASSPTENKPKRATKTPARQDQDYRSRLTDCYSAVRVF